MSSGSCVLPVPPFPLFAIVYCTGILSYVLGHNICGFVIWEGQKSKNAPFSFLLALFLRVAVCVRACVYLHFRVLCCVRYALFLFVVILLPPPATILYYMNGFFFQGLPFANCAPLSYMYVHFLFPPRFSLWQFHAAASLQLVQYIAMLYCSRVVPSSTQTRQTSSQHQLCVCNPLCCLVKKGRGKGGGYVPRHGTWRVVTAANIQTAGV